MYTKVIIVSFKMYRIVLLYVGFGVTNLCVNTFQHNLKKNINMSFDIMWTEEAEDLLINYIHARPEIWNPRDRHYKNRNKKAVAFSDVAALMAANCDMEEEDIPVEGKKFCVILLIFLLCFQNKT